MIFNSVVPELVAGGRLLICCESHRWFESNLRSHYLRVCNNVGVLAQMGEHLPCTQGVIGSIPIRSTNIVNLAIMPLCCNVVKNSITMPGLVDTR